MLKSSKGVRLFVIRAPNGPNPPRVHGPIFGSESAECFRQRRPRTPY
jgi:hypothetical protein